MKHKWKTQNFIIVPTQQTHISSDPYTVSYIQSTWTGFPLFLSLCLDFYRLLSINPYFWTPIKTYLFKYWHSVRYVGTKVLFQSQSQSHPIPRCCIHLRRFIPPHHTGSWVLSTVQCPGYFNSPGKLNHITYLSNLEFKSYINIIYVKFWI